MCVKRTVVKPMRKCSKVISYSKYMVSIQKKIVLSKERRMVGRFRASKGKLGSTKKYIVTI